MTDRELLELAAKAAGIDGKWHVESSAYSAPTGWLTPSGHTWNPLRNDGDALRLAVKLNRTDIGALIMNYTTGAEYRDCPYAATRRAIVRAAAEIGKGMKCQTN